MPNIIVIGSSTKSAAYTIKQLSMYGLNVTVYAWLDSPLRHSKYVNKYILAQSPDRDVKAFADGLLKYLELNKIDCLLAINDQALEICKLYYDQLSNYTKIIGINHSFTDEYAHSKYELIKVAAPLGIKSPDTILISQLSDVEGRRNEFTFPCIVKPASTNILKDNHLFYFRVSRVNSYEQLVDYVREHVSNVNILVQKIIPGYGIGYNIIAKDGEVLNEYIHRRLHEYIGESTYRESVSVEEYGLKEKAHALIKKINWNGVAMLEFRIDGNDAYIMEINGRFWGSIEVSVRCGLNYPVQLYEMQYLNKEIERGLPVKHVRVRNLKEEIINNIRYVVQQKSLKNLFKWFGTLKGVFASNEFIEDNVFDDPKFVLACYYYSIKLVWSRVVDELGLKSVSIAKHQAPVAEKNLVIAFACTGNICRSPFAEYYARKFNPQHSYFSFGISTVDNRLSPVNAVNAAELMGVDISKFSSASFDRQKVEQADYIFVMDRLNFYNLRQKGIDEKKIFFLDEIEIADPYGKPVEEFSKAYQQIIKCIKQKLPVHKAN